MSIVLRNTIRTARKQYDCAASEWISNYGSLAELMNDYKMPFSDRRILAIAKQERYKIFKGDKYQEQIGIYEGDFYCVKGRLDIVRICEKYDLYSE